MVDTMVVVAYAVPVAFAVVVITRRIEEVTTILVATVITMLGASNRQGKSGKHSQSSANRNRSRDRISIKLVQLNEFGIAVTVGIARVTGQENARAWVSAISSRNKREGWPKATIVR